MATRSKKLTATEKTMITKAAAKAAKFISGQKLSTERRKQIFETVQLLKGSRKPVVGKEAIALWAAKIDFAIANGDRPTVGKLIKTPTGAEAARATQFYDSNGGCSCGGGGGTVGGNEA